MSEPNAPSFFARLFMAFACFFRILFSARFAAQVLPLYRGDLLPANTKVMPPPKPSLTPSANDFAAAGLSQPKVRSRGQLATTPSEELDEGVVSAPKVMTRGAAGRPAAPVAPEPVATPAPVTRAAPKSPAAGAVAERPFASALFVLGALQREGRLIDFLQENVTSYSDEQVGAAARVVHEGCRKVIAQYLMLEPVVKELEGASVTVPPGFDAERIRLTGNITGKPPFLGALKHHGWVTSQVRFPTLSDSLDPSVLAPAEVELP